MVYLVSRERNMYWYWKKEKTSQRKGQQGKKVRNEEAELNEPPSNIPTTSSVALRKKRHRWNFTGDGLSRYTTIKVEKHALQGQMPAMKQQLKPEERCEIIMDFLHSRGDPRGATPRKASWEPIDHQVLVSDWQTRHRVKIKYIARIFKYATFLKFRIL